MYAPLIASLFGLRYHGLIFGVLDFSFTAGAAVGPVIAGYIFDVAGKYQPAFLTCAAVAIAGLIFTLFLKPAIGGEDKETTL